jgi:predicted transcriptional regulator
MSERNGRNQTLRKPRELPCFSSWGRLTDQDIPDILRGVAKVLVSLNDALLRRVDRIAKSRGLSRSAYIAELAERDASRLAGPGATPAARRSLARLDELFAGGTREDSTPAIRAERDAR